MCYRHVYVGSLGVIIADWNKIYCEICAEALTAFLQIIKVSETGFKTANLTFLYVFPLLLLQPSPLDSDLAVLPRAL